MTTQKKPCLKTKQHNTEQQKPTNQKTEQNKTQSYRRLWVRELYMISKCSQSLSHLFSALPKGSTSKPQDAAFGITTSSLANSDSSF